jgi:hypothetical protein
MTALTMPPLRIAARTTGIISASSPRPRTPEMTDLKAFTRDLARQMEVDLGTWLALGRLDFLESALAFMAGYGIKSFLIAQSLNQIEKAYGPNNAILDNCHVRVSFATNDERTAKRVSDALGTATEMPAMKNYAGHRLNPWLGHLMVSRQETARPLLTPGEVMQLPPTDEILRLPEAFVTGDRHRKNSRPAYISSIGELHTLGGRLWRKADIVDPRNLPRSIVAARMAAQHQHVGFN